MGQLMHRSKKRIVPLGPDTVAGRADGSPITLANPAASTHHARLIWSGERWEARDLGSTNGTFVDGRPLLPKESVVLTRGAHLRFGSEHEEWELIDDGPPAAAARRLSSDEVRVAENGLLALPGDEDVLESIVRTAADQWLVEPEDGTRRPARNGEQIQIAGDTWELTVPAPSPAASTYKARANPHLARATLRFLVSPGDRHVRLEIVEGGQAWSLGERACFRLLLLLAEKRLSDARSGVSADEQGWIHIIDALDPLGKTEETAINVYVHRARQAFTAARVEGEGEIVERRSREIRIGARSLEIVRS